MGLNTQIIYPESEYSRHATRCAFLFHGEQLSGEIENLLLNGPSAAKVTGFTDAQLWDATPGVMSFTGVGQYAEAPAEGTQVTLDGQSLIVTARIKKKLATHVVGTRYLFGNYKPGTTTGGFVCSVTTSGACGVTVTPVGGAAVNAFAPSGTITDGVIANERNLVWIISRNGQGRIGVDGVQAATATMTALQGANLRGGNPFYIGSQVEGFEMTHIGAYQVPLDIADIAVAQVFDWAYQNPAAMIPDWVFGL
jgi:hypothetical protein